MIDLAPSHLSRRNVRSSDRYRASLPLVALQVYVPAAYVGEAFACVVDRGRAVGSVGLICGNRARRDSDQTGTRMRVPPAVSSHGKRVLDDIDVRISLHLQLEIPPILVKLVAHQVDRARR